jgi:hypothetical protein
MDRVILDANVVYIFWIRNMCVFFLGIYCASRKEVFGLQCLCVRDSRYTPQAWCMNERWASEFACLVSEPQPLLWLTDQREYRIARPRL